MAPVRLERTTSGLEDPRSDPLSYEADKMEGTRGFEPLTCSFVASRARSVAPRPQI